LVQTKLCDPNSSFTSSIAITSRQLCVQTVF